MLGLCATIVKLSAPAMPKNVNAEVAWNYHEVTKHSYTSVRTNPHFLDFGNQPLPFKIYPALEPSRMPTEVRQTGGAAPYAIAGSAHAETKNPPAAIRHRSRAADHRLHLHVLAQCVEIPGTNLPAFRLGQRHAARQSPGN